MTSGAVTLSIYQPLRKALQLAGVKEIILTNRYLNPWSNSVHGFSLFRLPGDSSLRRIGMWVGVSNPRSHWQESIKVLLTTCAILHPIHFASFDNSVISSSLTYSTMSSDLTLAEVPIEVLLDNLLPYVQVPDILRLARTSKVRFLWTSNLINPYMSHGSSFQFFVLMIPCGSENYNRTSIFPVKQRLGQAVGNISIEGFTIQEVGSDIFLL